MLGALTRQRRKRSLRCMFWSQHRFGRKNYCLKLVNVWSEKRQWARLKYRNVRHPRRPCMSISLSMLVPCASFLIYVCALCLMAARLKRYKTLIQTVKWNYLLLAKCNSCESVHKIRKLLCRSALRKRINFGRFFPQPNFSFSCQKRRSEPVNSSRAVK